MRDVLAVFHRIHRRREGRSLEPLDVFSKVSLVSQASCKDACGRLALRLHGCWRMALLLRGCSLH